MVVVVFLYVFLFRFSFGLLQQIREEKKKESKQRREAAHREALAQASAHKAMTPRPVLGHHLMADGEYEGDEGFIEAPFLGPDVRFSF